MQTSRSSDISGQKTRTHVRQESVFQEERKQKLFLVQNVYLRLRQTENCTNISRFTHYYQFIWVILSQESLRYYSHFYRKQNHLNRQSNSNTSIFDEFVQNYPSELRHQLTQSSTPKVNNPTLNEPNYRTLLTHRFGRKDSTKGLSLSYIKYGHYWVLGYKNLQKSSCDDQF